MISRTLRIVIGGLVCALTLGGLSLAHAQQKKETPSKTEVRTRSSSTEVRRISTIVGGKFLVQGGTAFGKIEDIVINDTGCIEYVIIVHENHYYPIPWTIVDVDFGARVVAVDITRDRLLEGPSLAGWAEFSKTEWREKVVKHFGADSTRRERTDGKEERKESPKGKDAPKKETKEKDEAKAKPGGDSKEKAKGESKDKPKEKDKEKDKEKPKDQ